MPEAGGTTFWEIAQVGGAALAFCEGIAICFLWRAWRQDQDYIRDQDKNTLTVLNELTKVIDAASNSSTTGFADLRGAIQQSVEQIKGHIDASLRK